MGVRIAYVKRVIYYFDLKPEDLGATPQYFCEFFESCRFLRFPTKAIETGIFLIDCEHKTLLHVLKKSP
jgi:hypothetical protein